MNWSVIKNFGKVKYFNISYAVLILIPLIANTFSHINKEFSYNLEVPPMVKSLYVASILYAIGIAIYQYCCPAVIKEYENKQAFVKDNIEMFKNKAQDLKLNIVLTHLNKDTQSGSLAELLTLQEQIDQETSLVKVAKLKLELEEKVLLLYTGSVQTHLEKKFDEDNLRQRPLIWTCGILYVLGTLIIVILLILRTLIVFNT